MKLIKRISLKILILVLIAGIVGILGMAIMKWNINSMEKSYELLVVDNVENGLHMAKISSMIYRHQAIVTRHVLAKTMDEKLELEDEEKALNDKIRYELSELEKTMTGGERERLYHEVYSNTIGYFRNVDNVFKLSYEGSTETAEYYVNSVMGNFVANINQSVDDMKTLTDNEIVKAEAQMEKNIFYSNISTVVCVVCIVVTVAVCLFLCAGITARLGKYQSYLESEIESKTSS
jgi:CHASE3 domain sensor protein